MLKFTSKNGFFHQDVLGAVFSFFLLLLPLPRNRVEIKDFCMWATNFHFIKRVLWLMIPQRIAYPFFIISFIFYLADSRSIWNCLRDMWAILAIHSSVYSRCNHSHASNHDRSFRVEVETRCSHFHHPSPFVHHTVQRVLQDPFPSYILPVLNSGNILIHALLFSFSFIVRLGREVYAKNCIINKKKLHLLANSMYCVFTCLSYLDCFYGQDAMENDELDEKSGLLDVNYENAHNAYSRSSLRPRKNSSPESSSTQPLVSSTWRCALKQIETSTVIKPNKKKFSCKNIFIKKE